MKTSTTTRTSGPADAGSSATQTFWFATALGNCGDLDRSDCWTFEFEGEGESFCPCKERRAREEKRAKMTGNDVASRMGNT
jgi:hypothetical protein